VDDRVLEVEDLTVDYAGTKGRVTAVDRVSLTLEKSEFLGIVAIARLLNPPAEIVGGSVRFKGRDLVLMREKEIRHVRWREFSVVMQSAMNALNPVMTLGTQLRDAMQAHERISRRDAHQRAAEVLRLVSIDPLHLKSYPHQLSGGMRQRAMIAMALVFTPDLIIMDEPTSALDVVAQRSLMMQIKALQIELNFAVIFVTHDISLLTHFSDLLAIMYAGEVVELGSTASVFADPNHPYSVGLLAAFPSISGPRHRLQGIPGVPPDLRNLPTGCRFHPRCPRVMPHCLSVDPPAYQPAGRSVVRCHLYANEEVESGSRRTTS
jgi:peptide/nickel transport system ATP-binding protein